MAMSFCPRCGAALPAQAVFCPRCGTPVPATEAAGTAPAPYDAGVPAQGAAAAAGDWTAAGPAATPPAYGPPAAPPGATWGSTTPAAVPMVYAGFWRRFAALFLDGLVLSLVTVPLRHLVGLPTFFDMHDPERFDPGSVFSMIWASMLFNMAQCLLWWFYSAALQSSRSQATLGMLALDLRVTDVAGRRISFARATGRFFATLISSLTLGIGYLIMLFTERRQTLHDLIAGTLVLRGRARS